MDYVLIFNFFKMGIDGLFLYLEMSFCCINGKCFCEEIKYLLIS